MSKAFTIKKQLAKMKDDAYNGYQKLQRPKASESLKRYGSNCTASLNFIFSEKENIFFAFLSLLVVVAGYFVGIKIIDWIPQSVWDSVGEDKSNNSAMLNLILTLWFFVCVGLVAFVNGILTACIEASYLLRFQGRESTIADCLKTVMPRCGALWVFSWLDGWWTFRRILERLPRKTNRISVAAKIYKETVYQAWKLASLGFMPALLCGRSISEACKDSLQLMGDRFSMLGKLRLGYSLCCWVIVMCTYVGFLLFICYVPHMDMHSIYSIYVIIGFPLMIALTLIILILRPLYIISACRIFAFWAKEKEIPVNLPQSSGKIGAALPIFILLLLAVAIVLVWHDELGLTELLSRLLQQK